MNLLEIMQKRHSIRKYTEEAIPEESLRTVVQAGLLSASSRSIRPWELIVVRDRDTLKKMSDCRVGAAKMLAGASAAIVAAANPADFCLEAVLSLGMPQAHPAKTELSELSMDKVHWEKY